MSCEPVGQRRYRNFMALVLTVACVFCVYYALDTRSSAHAMRFEVEGYRAANERAMLVMVSIRDRAALARELQQWFDALATLDALGTLARMNPDSKVLLEQFTIEFNKTVAAAQAARKAHEDALRSNEGSRGLHPERGKDSS